MAKRSFDNSAYPEPVNRLIEELSRLPGVGQRSAERMAFQLLKASREEAMRLSQAVADVKDSVRNCSICFNLTAQEPCRICAAPDREAGMVLVVEQPKDVISFEQTGLYRGVYHVLMGRLDPLAGVDPEHLTVDRLLLRVRDATQNARGESVREVILGLNPDLEGDTTSLYLAEELQGSGVKVTRLARGLPTGSQLEFASSAVLADAIADRRDLHD